MPRLMFEGDVRNSLGDKFPTVYFSNISVFDNRVEVELNCFVEEMIVDEIRESLKIYLIPVYNENLYNSILSNPNDLFGEIIAGNDSNSPVYRAPGGAAVWRPTTGPSTSDDYFRRFLIEDFEEIRTRNYNPNDNEFYKLKFNKNLSDLGEDTQYLNYLSFVAFSTFLKPEEIQSFIDTENFMSMILDQVSLISHTKVIENLNIVNETFNSYLLGEQQYHGKVIQDLNNGYRANSEQQFTRLLSQLSETNTRFSGTGDQQLQSFVDSCSYIVSTQSAQIDFLKQLKSVLDSFPSRTSTSPIGNYYNSLKTLIFAFNDFLLTQVLLEKKLVTTFHNFDFRNVQSDNTGAVRAPYESFYDLRNSLLSRYNEEFIYDAYMDRTRRITSVLARDEDAQDIVEQGLAPSYNHTYFLFDYEKALHKTSNISQIFNVDELLLYFGENCLSPYFQFSSVLYGRLHPSSTGGQQTGCNIRGNFNTIDFNDGGTPGALREGIENLNSQVESIYAAFIVDETTPERAGLRGSRFVKVDSEDASAGNSEELNSFIAQRNVETVIQPLGDYKLSCFEVGDIQTNANIQTAYRFSVQIKDYTTNFVIDQIIAPANKALEALRRYYDLASDFCSYNDLDNKFNDFFIEYVEQEFDFMEQPPWVLAPIWFRMITNLVTREAIESTSDALYNLIFAEIVKISPTTGNLDNIPLLISRLEELLSTFEEGGVIHEKMYGGSNADGTRAGNGLIDNIDNRFVRIFEDLPAILDQNKITYDYEYEKAREEAMFGEFKRHEVSFVLYKGTSFSRLEGTKDLLNTITRQMRRLQALPIERETRDLILNALLYYYEEELAYNDDVDFYRKMGSHYSGYIDKPKKYGPKEISSKELESIKNFNSESDVLEEFDTESMFINLFIYFRAFELEAEPEERIRNRTFLRNFMLRLLTGQSLSTYVARQLSTEQFDIDPDDTEISDPQGHEGQSLVHFTYRVQNDAFKER